MSAGLRLTQNLRQRLELQLTPRQILQNEILVLPVHALRELVQQEVDENVFLETGGDSRTVDAEPPPATAPTRGEDFSGPVPDDQEAMRNLAVEGAFFDYLKGNRGANGGVSREVGEDRNLEAFLSKGASWREALVDQLRMAPLDKDIQNAAIYLVGCLDDRGNLEETLEALARESGSDVELLEEGLKALQSEAPPGVGARDLRERLLLQLQALPEREDVAEQIVEQCWDDLLKGRFHRISERLELEEDELLDALRAIRELATEPDGLDSGEEAVAVEPDATVIKIGDRWVVDIHDGGLPPIRVSKDTAALLSRANTLDGDTRQFIQAKLSRARWMREAVERRRSTLRKILEEIVQRQQDFFDKGPDAMHPLRQDEIAEAVQLHPSRVSRAIQDKYIETPRGVFPLKIFFPRGIKDDEGTDLARDSVQSTLQRIVDSEDPTSPFSDDQLVDLLRNQHIDISRRTVCKYRDELGIPPASARKGLYHKLRGLSHSRG